MDDLNSTPTWEAPPPPPPPVAPPKRAVIRSRTAAAAVGFGLLAGGIIGGYAIANAATSSSPSATPSGPSSSGTNAGQPPARGNFDPSKGGHMANGITEKLLTGATADKVTAAAKAAVPGATVQRVENDAEGSPYEAHMQKSDGSIVTVKVDSNFKVTSVINGLG